MGFAFVFYGRRTDHLRERYYRKDNAEAADADIRPTGNIDERAKECREEEERPVVGGVEAPILHECGGMWCSDR